MARVQAEEEIDRALPPSAAQVDWEISRMGRDQRVEQEMQRLMGG